MATGALVALILVPCMSVLHQSSLGNETIAMVCPSTVQYVYDTPTPTPVQATRKPVAVHHKAAPSRRYYHRWHRWRKKHK